MENLHRRYTHENYVPGQIHVATTPSRPFLHVENVEGSSDWHRNTLEVQEPAGIIAAPGTFPVDVYTVQMWKPQHGEFLQ